MPPLYDNINDAFELIADGASHALPALDNTGATFETNESTNAEPQESVWVKIDLSEYNGTISIPFTLVQGAGDPAFAPQFGIYKVVDPSFDPASPDFSKLANAWYVGDGSTGPISDTVDFTGGTGSTTGIASINGIFYLAFNDYNYAVYGSATGTYTIPAPPICVNAVDVINPSSPTASIVSGRVREDWNTYWDYGASPHTVPEKTLKWTWAGPAGYYQMGVTGQAASAPSNGLTFIIIVVNGRCFMRGIGQGITDTSSHSWIVHNGFAFGSDPVGYDASDYSLNPWIPLSPGDEIEIMVTSGMEIVSVPNTFVPFEIEKVCFYLDGNATGVTYCTPSIQFGTKPLGDEWGSYRAWGGQKLVPDQIFTHLGQTPYDDTAGNFAWGIGFSDFDIAVLPDGTIYAVYMDAISASTSVTNFHSGNFANAENSYYYMVVKKYDPNTNTWTQIATLNHFDPIDGSGHDAGCLAGPHHIESANAYYDPIGGFVYFAWVEGAYYYTNFPNLLQKAYVARLDPSDDSITMLGDGVAALGHANLGNYDRASTLGVDIAVTENGDVYIGTVEITTATEPSSPKRKPFVWRWNGSTWTNLNLPDPSNLADTNWRIDGENQFWDQLVMVIPYRRDGSQDGITVFFSYNNDGSEPNFWEARRSCTIEYTPGGGWTNEVLTVWPDVERKYPPYKRTNSENVAADPTEFSTFLFDPTIMWSQKLGRLVLTGDLLIASGEEIWDMFQMNDSNDQWELLEPDTGPPASAGPWRQSRNSAAIGPDGEIYRAVMSDHIQFDFFPHVIKHSPQYGFGYADACRRHIGEGVTQDANGLTWNGVYAVMGATANYRIRWVGNTCYVIVSLYAEPLNVLDLPEDDGDLPHADGVFVFKGVYTPCGGPLTFNKIVPLR